MLTPAMGCCSLVRGCSGSGSRAGFSLAFMAPWLLTVLVSLLLWPGVADAMPARRIEKLRAETVDMFYHGYDNYMDIAFPEDELRPVSCVPLTRDTQNPGNIALNDVLGNYSLTLIDSLSTLAILASAPPDKRETGPKALRDFQDGVAALVEQYGDGTSGPSGQGLRGRGFDVDSKVQVFETVIRGVGGLLSAHLFAIGELPINGYHPPRSEDTLKVPTISWPNGLKYDGQLLRLALDLATRLLPAFYSPTGMPYPRVNLRHGIPFYVNSPLYGTDGAANVEGPPEITETCSAGAGSLVLEFTVLSRLTGDPKFEELAKRAFWAVWYRRSEIGLIGAGVDAEHGKWVGAFSVIGAGADSFFEYALKSHILLSGHGLPNRTGLETNSRPTKFNPNPLFPPLSDEENSPDSFLAAWHQAHAAIKRHLYSDRDHPHYVNVNIWTGSLASQWIDSLGAYYSGLLTLAGELEEAIETNLLYTAVWTKYSALPERWSLRDKTVEGGLGWWPLRPEFIESVYHIYRATKDPWYLYVGEMVLRDITRRCWTECGWAGLQNVLDGEKSDRMESFFLGETAKYMYLLFDDGHPLNSLDAAYVFTTEGHPLIIPKKQQPPRKKRAPAVTTKEVDTYTGEPFTNSCPVPPKEVPLTGSIIAARTDIYHPSRLLDLHLAPDLHAAHYATSLPGPLTSLSNYTFYPWTLPPSLLPDDGICAKVNQPVELSLEFAQTQQQPAGGSAFNIMLGNVNLERLSIDKIRVLSISGLKLTLRLEDENDQEWRITRVNNVPLGRDESVVIDRAVLGQISDPRFNLVRDPVVVKLHHLHQVILGGDNDTTPDMAPSLEDAETEEAGFESASLHIADIDAKRGSATEDGDNTSTSMRPSDIATLFKSFFQHIVSSLDGAPLATGIPGVGRHVAKNQPYNILLNASAITPTGIGAAPLPPVDIPPGSHVPSSGAVDASVLPWTTVFAAGDACAEPLPESAPRDHQVILVRRGGCSFGEKLANIPPATPKPGSLQLVVVVSDDDNEGGQAGREGGGGEQLIRPLLDDVQRTPGGLVRRHPIAMVMVGGGEAAYAEMAGAARLGISRRHYVESQGLRVRNLIIDDGETANLL
ncbi:uncharacterized protein E0L32_010155 [Thyridium curvatum]|uniref:alpha-1,2-Mannosidase n=1 Tax=Thyridium curvatum TaxID=1093900 RepID=A0A507AFP8_9PEZI|nr:uncharacterized protein E0L32_010155 [Thyridium curvatum]TPX08425.1 hypothetical protein E0L32_010155 [Thyridium curvatum]